MNTAPRVSVVIPAYNAEEHLDEDNAYSRQCRPRSAEGFVIVALEIELDDVYTFQVPLGAVMIDRRHIDVDLFYCLAKSTQVGLERWRGREQ